MDVKEQYKLNKVSHTKGVQRKRKIGIYNTAHFEIK